MEWVLAAICVLLAPLILAIFAIVRAEAANRRLDDEVEALRREVRAVRGELRAAARSAATRGEAAHAAPTATEPPKATPAPAALVADPWSMPPLPAAATSGDDRGVGGSGVAATAESSPASELVLDDEVERASTARSAMESLRRRSAAENAGPLPPLPEASAAAAAEHGPRVAAHTRSAAEVEQHVGGRIFVWIGALALFLAGAFFVKYTFDQGLLTPQLRVIVGGLFGAVLIGVGERLRLSSRHVASGVTAAGVSILYACLLAATNLYHLLPPLVGFGLLAANTALAMLLSLRQGAFVAGLGLIGGFATPALIGDTEPNAVGLFGYLALLQCGLLVLGRHRRWWPLSLVTLLAGFVWVGLWLLRGAPASDGVWLAAFLLVSITLFVWTYDAAQAAGDERGGASPHGANMLVPAAQTAAALRWLGLAGAATGSGLLGLVAAYSGYSPRDWGLIALLCAGSLVLGRLRKTYEPFALITAVLTLILLYLWHRTTPAPAPEALRWTSLMFGGLFAAGGFAALWGARRASLFGGFSAGAGVAFWSLAYGLTRDAPETPAWEWQCLLLAGAYAAAAALVYLRRGEDAELNRALGALCVASTFFLGAYVPLALRPEWVFVGWALQAAAIVAIAGALRLPELHRLAVAVGALAVGRAVTPNVVDWPLGNQPIFNWILFAYGVTVAALVEASRFAARQAAIWVSQAFEGGACLLGFVGLSLMVRHAFHPVVLLPEDGLAANEVATFVTAWLGLACVLLAMVRRFDLAVSEVAATAACGISMVASVVALTAAANTSWWQPQLSATPIWNQLLYWLGGPAVLFTVAGFLFRDRVSTAKRNAALASGVVCLFLMVSAEVRHGFHANQAVPTTTGSPEVATLLVVWLTLACAMLWVVRSFRQTVWELAAIGICYLSMFGCVMALVLAGETGWWSPHLAKTAFWNDLLYWLGLPSALYFVAGFLLRDDRDPLLHRLMHGAAAILLLLLVSAEVMHAYRFADLFAIGVPAREAATYVLVWLGLSLAASFYRVRRGLEVARTLHWGTLGLAAAMATLGVCLGVNPLFASQPVGATPVLNWLIYIFAIPAAAFAYLAVLWRAKLAEQVLRAMSAIALVLLFVFITAEVRQAFFGSTLTGPPPMGLELYAYSVAWGLLSLVLLGAGLWTGGVVLRWASLVVMLIAVGKVFLVDTARLQDLYRVLSLLGLGLSLMAIGFVYQRLVFRRTRAAVEA
ncbi:MAG: DUF2339 domain-containing protein [Phycisphaerae bacterium]|nr:DUF2339 domain-containing protein [Phycisphaerae bacterium]